MKIHHVPQNVKKTSSQIANLAREELKVSPVKPHLNYLHDLKIKQKKLKDAKGLTKTQSIRKLDNANAILS